MADRTKPPDPSRVDQARRGVRILWLGGFRFGPWRGFWHGEGRKYRWMFDVGPVRVIRYV